MQFAAAWPSLSLITALLGLFLVGPRTAAAQAALTFTVRYESKLFIDRIPVTSCGPVRALGLPPVNPTVLPVYQARFAAYMTFCIATDLIFQENPPTGAIITPLDSRIAGPVTLSYRCRAGNTLPIAPVSLVAAPSAGGPEPMNFTGVANPTTLRDGILASGSWGMVVSGHPHRLGAEPPFQAIEPRLRTNIWNRLAGRITCGVDARGLPTSHHRDQLRTSLFPSHRVWFRSPANAPQGKAKTHIYVKQASFGELWNLPAVPAP